MRPFTQAAAAEQLHPPVGELLTYEAAVRLDQPFVQRDVCPEPASVQIQLALARAMSNIVSTGSGAPGFGRGHVSAAFASQSKSAAPTAVCSAWAGVVSGSRKARSRGRKGSFTFSEIARSGHSGTRRRSGAVAHRQAMPCIGAAGTVGRPEFAACAIPRCVDGPGRQSSGTAAISGCASLRGIPPFVQSAVSAPGGRVAEIRRRGPFTAA